MGLTPRASVSADLERSPGVCISNKFPGDAEDAGPGGPDLRQLMPGEADVKDAILAPRIPTTISVAACIWKGMDWVLQHFWYPSRNSNYKDCGIERLFL